MSLLIRLLPFLGFASFAAIGMLFLDGRLTPRPNNCWDPAPVEESGALPQCEPHRGHDAFHSLILAHRH